MSVVSIIFLALSIVLLGLGFYGGTVPAEATGLAAMLSQYQNLLLIAGGLGMMVPGTLTDVMGLVIVGGIVLYQRISAKRLAA